MLILMLIGQILISDWGRVPIARRSGFLAFPPLFRVPLVLAAGPKPGRIGLVLRRSVSPGRFGSIL